MRASRSVIADCAAADVASATERAVRSAIEHAQSLNADVFGFSLAEDEVAAISALERGRLWDGDPDTHEEF